MVFLDVLDVSDGIIESLLGKIAGLSWVIQALIVEDRVVKGQSESDGVGGFKLGVGDVRGSLVGFVGTLGDFLVDLSLGVLRNVSEVVTLHFEVENL